MEFVNPGNGDDGDRGRSNDNYSQMQYLLLEEWQVGD